MLKKKTFKPLVSVILPVYNAERFLTAAIQSVLNQTYSRWELVIVDDWSTDGSWSIARDFAKQNHHIKLLRNARHSGVADAANLAINNARGKFLARMDADDIMHPERLQKQVDFLLTHPKVVLLGTQCILIDENGNATGEKTFPTTNKALKKMIFRSIPIQQPSMMFNLALLPKNFLFYEQAQNTAEEVAMIFRLMEYGRLANLPDFLHYYRLHGTNTSLINPKKTFYLTFITRLQAKNKYHYQVTVSDYLFNFVQLAVVLILPKKLIYPLYNWWRNLHFTWPSFFHLGRLFKIEA